MRRRIPRTAVFPIGIAESRAGRRLPAAEHAPFELRLKEAEERYRLLVESLPMTVYVSALDVQGAFTYISPRVETMLGYTWREWLADRSLWLKSLHPDDRGRVLLALARSHRGHEGIREEYRLLDRRGRAHWIKDESRVARDEAGRPLFIQGTWTEITGRKRMEDESARKSRQLAASQLEVTELVSVASHELTAPLRRIVNLGESLARRGAAPLDAPARDMLARIVDSASDVQELLRGLVLYAEQGGSRTHSTLVDLGELVDRAAGGLVGQVEKHGAGVTKSALPRVWTEPALLERVLCNLLENALKFRSRRPPRIHVSAKRAADEWVVSVQDNGVGMDPGLARRAFALGARAGRGGVGLSLSICNKLVQLLGGRMWVESEPGEGSIFRFTLPARAEGGQP